MDICELSSIFKLYTTSNVSKTIDPNDAMYKAGPDWYFSCGESGLRYVLSTLSLTWLKNVSRILDIPCGHGRVGRHFRAAFQDAEIFFSDIDKHGVDFCCREFQGTGIYSELELTNVKLPQRLDVIWVGSLFSHVSRTKTFSWLSFLAQHLSTHGILVATFHGYFTAQNPPISARVDIDRIQREFHSMGYGFEAYPKDDPVQLGEYGFSLSKPSALLDMANAIPAVRILSYTERGWAANHDVMVICRDDRLRPFNI